MARGKRVKRVRRDAAWERGCGRSGQGPRRSSFVSRRSGNQTMPPAFRLQPVVICVNLRNLRMDPSLARLSVPLRPLRSNTFPTRSTTETQRAPRRGPELEASTIRESAFIGVHPRLLQAVIRASWPVARELRPFSAFGLPVSGSFVIFVTFVVSWIGRAVCGAHPTADASLCVLGVLCG